jgi:toxin YhaV
MSREIDHLLDVKQKEGDKKDCYLMFSRMVTNGNFPEDMTSFLNFLQQSDNSDYDSNSLISGDVY